MHIKSVDIHIAIFFSFALQGELIFIMMKAKPFSVKNKYNAIAIINSVYRILPSR